MPLSGQPDLQSPAMYPRFTYETRNNSEPGIEESELGVTLPDRRSLKRRSLGSFGSDVVDCKLP